MSEFQSTVPRLVLIVGHTKKAPGATFALGGSEYQYNSKVAELASSYAKTLGTIDVKVVFRDGIGISGAYAKAKALKPDCTIELHFNAANKTATGTETLCTPEEKDRKFSEIVQKSICKVFKREGLSRGVKVLAKGARGAGNIYSLPGFANCLVEPFFGDAMSDAKIAKEKQADYAKCLVDASVSYFKTVGLI